MEALEECVRAFYRSSGGVCESILTEPESCSAVFPTLEEVFASVVVWEVKCYHVP